MHLSLSDAYMNKSLEALCCMILYISRGYLIYIYIYFFIILSLSVS